MLCAPRAAQRRHREARSRLSARRAWQLSSAGRRTGHERQHGAGDLSPRTARLARGAGESCRAAEGAVGASPTSPIRRRPRCSPRSCIVMAGQVLPLRAPRRDSGTDVASVAARNAPRVGGRTCGPAPPLDVCTRLLKDCLARQTPLLLLLLHACLPISTAIWHDMQHHTMLRAAAQLAASRRGGFTSRRK